ncbi:L-fucose mutarotase [Tichowtungia aerotolerans]|uniref:L-fucose mutarotase n=1 Tax=Tichowtungia aerotolerans TaxID=2697043 RepID=A0A6P1M981_9BACT|nr:L-fucose mutarotase [Tichowtungia aerotolerans]QHI69104.1 L-fucose mutarotase [Tichowtungia aerotolerans]
MLKGISPIISPELLKILAEMGHGDELVLADAKFPGHSCCNNVIRADGLRVTELLEGIMPLFELDTYEHPLFMMAPAGNDALDPEIEAEYMNTIRKHSPEAPTPERIERFAFYRRAANAYACVMTGEQAGYSNLIIKKG